MKSLSLRVKSTIFSYNIKSTLQFFVIFLSKYQYFYEFLTKKSEIFELTFTLDAVHKLVLINMVNQGMGNIMVTMGTNRSIQVQGPGMESESNKNN